MKYTLEKKQQDRIGLSPPPPPCSQAVYTLEMGARASAWFRPTSEAAFKDQQRDRMHCPLKRQGKAPSLDGGTHRLGCFYGNKSVIPFLPTNVSKGPVICDVLCNVGNFVNSMMMLKGLSETKGRAHFTGLSLRAVDQ